MYDFFNDFFQSDIAKNNRVAFIVAVILLLVIGATLMWLYLSKIHYVRLENKNAKLEEEVQKQSEEIKRLTKELEQANKRSEQLVAESDKLRFYDRVVLGSEEESGEDEALEQFTHN